MAALPYSPARPNSVRASRRRVQQIAAEELDVPFASLKVDHRRYQAYRERGLYVRQQLRQGQRHRDTETRRLKCVLYSSRKRPRGSIEPVESLRTENGAVVAADGRRLTYGELVAADMLHVQAQPKSKLKDPATFSADRPVCAARRHPGKSHRRRGLRPGLAVARHGARPRRAPAELWRAIDANATHPPSRGFPASLKSCATAISSPSWRRRNSSRSRR